MEEEFDIKGNVSKKYEIFKNAIITKDDIRKHNKEFDIINNSDLEILEKKNFIY